MATRKTGGKKAAPATAKKAAPRRRARKASAKASPKTAAAPVAPAAVAGTEAPAGTAIAADSFSAAPQGTLVEVARTIGSTLGAIASTTRSALHKGKRPKKSS